MSSRQIYEEGTIDQALNLQEQKIAVDIELHEEYQALKRQKQKIAEKKEFQSAGDNIQSPQDPSSSSSATVSNFTVKTTSQNVANNSSSAQNSKDVKMVQNAGVTNQAKSVQQLHPTGSINRPRAITKPITSVQHGHQPQSIRTNKFGPGSNLGSQINNLVQGVVASTSQTHTNPFPDTAKYPSTPLQPASQGVKREVLDPPQTPSGADGSDRDDDGDPYKKIDINLDEPLKPDEILPVRTHRVVTDIPDAATSPDSKKKKSKHRKEKDSKKEKKRRKEEKEGKKKKRKPKHVEEEGEEGPNLMEDHEEIGGENSPLQSPREDMNIGAEVTQENKENDLFFDFDLLGASFPDNQPEEQTPQVKVTPVQDITDEEEEIAKKETTHSKKKKKEKKEKKDKKEKKKHKNKLKAEYEEAEGITTPSHEEVPPTTVNSKLVELLLKHGANPLQANSKGKTPLDVASSPEMVKILKREVISSGSDCSSIEDTRSPMSQDSISSLKDEDRSLDVDEVNNTTAGSTNNRRMSMPKSPENKLASPRLCLKFQRDTFGNLNQKFKDSKEPQYKSYSVTNVSVDSSVDQMFSPVDSPASSADSDAYNPHIDGISSLNFNPVKMAIGDEDLSHGLSVLEQSNNGPERNSHRELFPSQGVVNGRRPVENHQNVFNSVTENNGDSVLTLKHMETKPFIPSAHWSDSQNNNLELPDLTSPLTSSSSLTSLPVTNSVTNSVSVGHSDNSGCNSVTSSSVLHNVSQGEGGPPLSSMVTSTTGSNNLSLVTNSVDPEPSGLSALTSTHSGSVNCNTGPTSVTTNMAESSTLTNLKWELRSASSPKLDDSPGSSGPGPHRSDSFHNLDSPSRPDKDSKSDNRESRPSTPKVPPLKIIIPTKSQASSSTDSNEGLKLVVTNVKSALPYVINPYQDQGREAEPIPSSELLTSQSAEHSNSVDQDQPTSQGAVSDSAVTDRIKSQDHSLSDKSVDDNVDLSECSLVDSTKSQDRLNDVEEESRTDLVVDDGKSDSDSSKKGDKKDEPTQRVLRSAVRSQQTDSNKPVKQKSVDKTDKNSNADSPSITDGTITSTKPNNVEEEVEETIVFPRKRKFKTKSELSSNQTVTVVENTNSTIPGTLVDKVPNSYDLFFKLRRKGGKSQTATTSKLSGLPLPPVVDNSDLIDPVWTTPQSAKDPCKKQPPDPRKRDPRLQMQPSRQGSEFMKGPQDMEGAVSSTVRSTSKDRDSKSYPNLKDTFEVAKRKHDSDKEREKEKDSKFYKKDSGSRYSDRSSRSREKSPPHPSKHQSNKNNHKGSGDNSVSPKNVHDNRNRDRYKDNNSSKASDKKSSNHSDSKRENKSADSRQDSYKAPNSIKREKASLEGDAEGKASKKPKLSAKEETVEVKQEIKQQVDMEVDQKPNVNVSNDRSELFSSKDIDHRPVDTKGLPLKSPSRPGRPEFNRPGPHGPEFDRPGPHGPELDRPEPPNFDRHGPLDNEFNRHGPPRSGTDKGPFRPGFDRHRHMDGHRGPPRPEFEGEFGRDGPPFDRHRKFRDKMEGKDRYRERSDRRNRGRDQDWHRNRENDAERYRRRDDNFDRNRHGPDSSDSEFESRDRDWKRRHEEKRSSKEKDDRRGSRTDKEDRRGRQNKEDKRGPERSDKDEGRGRPDRDDRRDRFNTEDRRGHLQPSQPQDFVVSYVDKYGDSRFRSFTDMGPEVSEKVVFGKRNYEIKLGAPPRKIPWGNGYIEVYADPIKRGVVIDNELMYRFGERVKEVNIRGKREEMFYHGQPLDIWIDGNKYEVRVDSPPKTLIINNQPHKIQVDGRDMMILINKAEMGPYGGEPRFILIDDMRMELRFDPPPRHSLIDGEKCELKLNTNQPCINIKGVLHGIRFKGPPRDLFINGTCYQVHTDHAVKLKVGNRFHYVALGGPYHELIVDGKWYEVKFDQPPKEISVGNRALMVNIPGGPPEVKVLDPIPMDPVYMPMFNPPGPMRMPMPGPPGQLGPMGPGPMGPPQMIPGMPPGMMMGPPVTGPNPMVNPAIPSMRPPMAPQPTTGKPGLQNVKAEAPSSPQYLQASDITKNSVKLSWQPPKETGGAPVSGYVIDRLDLDQGDVTTAPIDDLTKNHRYNFRVYAQNKYGTSEPSELYEAIRATSGVDVPSAPEDLKVKAVTADTVTLTWAAPKSDGDAPLIGYEVEKRDAGRQQWTRVTRVSPKETTYTVPKLLEGQAYVFRVMAENSEGLSEPATLDKAVTPEQELKKPHKPTGPLEATDIMADHLKLSWNKPEYDGGSRITGYIIEKSEARRPKWVRVARVGPEDLSTEVDNLLENQDYYFRVMAENSMGLSPPLEMSKPVKPVSPYSPPSVPVGPIKVLQVTRDSATIQWQPSASDGGTPITNYLVEQREGSRRMYYHIGKTDADKTDIKITNLRENTEYHFRVVAENKVGTSPALETDQPVVPKRKLEKPEPPTALRASEINSTAVTLSWDAPYGDDTITNYIIEKRKEHSDEWTRAGRVPGKSHRITGLTAGGAFFFRVSAENPAGVSVPAELPVVVELKGRKEYPPKLSQALDGELDLSGIEAKMMEAFKNPDRELNWREGTKKESFNYLLLDPRITKDLPNRAINMDDLDILITFISSIFYVGKGQKSRPHKHLYEAREQMENQNGKASSKVQQIIDIWSCGLGVVSVQCFQNRIPEESYTREACMVDAIGIENLTNEKRGNYYGESSRFSMNQRRKVGVYMLKKALEIFRLEGETQILPVDLKK